MFVLRSTQKLLKRLKQTPQPDPPESTTTLGDWYADVRPVRPRHLLLLVSDKTRFPVVIPAAPMSNWQSRFFQALTKQLLTIGSDPSQVEAELAQMQQMVIAKTASRSVLGTMLDYRTLMNAYGPVEDLHLVSLRLGYAPCGPLNMKSSIEVTRRALGFAGQGCYKPPDW